MYEKAVKVWFYWRLNLNIQPVYFTFFRLSSLLSKAHCCLHCSHVCGGPHLLSELVHRWHLFPIKAASMLQYSQAVGWKKELIWWIRFILIRHWSCLSTQSYLHANVCWKYKKTYFSIFMPVSICFVQYLTSYLWDIILS